MKIFPHTRFGWIRLSVLILVPALLFSFAYHRFLYMPGRSFTGELPPLSNQVDDLKDRLRVHVTKLATDIGPRNIAHEGSLAATVRYLNDVFHEIGYATSSQRFQVVNATVENLEAVRVGGSLPGEIIVIGAHYDTQTNAPGANDNGTGVAALLEIARAIKIQEVDRTIRFVAFVNEEPPYFHKPVMGSLVYARRCKEREENIVAMISIETIGCYSDEKGSQKYPAPFHLFFPRTGNFIGFVGNEESGDLVRQCVGLFRESTQFPSEGASIPERVPGAGWSDHWSFWQQGYPGIMVTDTALYRYDYYHTPEDTADKVDFDKTARVVEGLIGVVGGLANSKE